MIAKITQIDDQIIVSGMPKKNDWVVFKEIGIKHVVNLMMEPHNNEFVGSFGIKVLHVPVKNYSPPSIKQIEQILSFIEDHSQEKILIHCWAGLGRTGTIVACHFVKHHMMTPSKAINR